ncbi:hypothetical protein [Marinilactibacillus sp. Marseille-P9653]|uniref:hypothetical protein n=1 Tax=Marinilactibacillus sp. Marseille-P9653 TaxID=2866583 RepID=UPI001CE3CDEB|nr:hypothetical protein [Marinilactibacillus sp. Marseille-P9653]
MKYFIVVLLALTIFSIAGCDLESVQEEPENQTETVEQESEAEAQESKEFPDDLNGVGLVDAVGQENEYSYYFLDGDLGIYDGNIQGYSTEDIQAKFIEAIESVQIEETGDAYTVTAEEFELILIKMGGSLVRNADNGDEYEMVLQ